MFGGFSWYRGVALGWTCCGLGGVAIVLGLGVRVLALLAFFLVKLLSTHLLPQTKRKRTSLSWFSPLYTRE